MSNLAAISTTVGSTVPLYCGRWGKCLVRTLYYPSWCGWNCRYLLTQQRYYSNQHYCRRGRPPIVLRTVGKLPCSEVMLPVFVRLVPMGTATIMQRAALLYARPPPLAVGGETTLFGGCTAHLCAVGIVGSDDHSSEQHYCRCDRPPLVRSVGKLLCSSVLLTLSSDWHM